MINSFSHTFLKSSPSLLPGILLLYISHCFSSASITLDILEKSGYILPRMKYQIVIAKSAQEAFKKLDARWRSALKEAMRTHLESAPKQESKSRIKRLRGLRQPQYRLRVDRLRVFYDVNDEQGRVEVLGFVMKPEAENWLQEHGVPE